MRLSRRGSASIGLGVAGLLVGAAALVVWLVVRPDGPADGRCAELWNAPENQGNRAAARGRPFPLVTVRGAGPNKAGQPGCTVLLREREDGPWLLFGATFVSETRVVWDVGVAGVRYGIDSPTGGVDDMPNATLRPDGSLVLERP